MTLKMAVMDKLDIIQLSVIFKQKFSNTIFIFNLVLNQFYFEMNIQSRKRQCQVQLLAAFQHLVHRSYHSILLRFSMLGTI